MVPEQLFTPTASQRERNSRREIAVVSEGDILECEQEAKIFDSLVVIAILLRFKCSSFMSPSSQQFMNLWRRERESRRGW
jgi:hypothetical protein